jgi:hypothetical protein
MSVDDFDRDDIEYDPDDSDASYERWRDLLPLTAYEPSPIGGMRMKFDAHSRALTPEAENRVLDRIAKDARLQRADDSQLAGGA